MATKSDAPATTTSGTVQKRSLTEQFHASMVARATENGAIDRGDDVMEAQAERILMAEGADAILKADLGGTVQCRDVPGTYWEIRGMEPVLSNRPDLDTDYYVQFDAVCLGGDQDVMARNGLQVGVVYPLQTAAILLTTKVKAFEAAGELPQRLALIGLKTGKGNTVLKWGPMPATAVPGNVA